MPRAACARHHMHVVVRGRLLRVSSLLPCGFCSLHLGWLLPAELLPCSNPALAMPSIALFLCLQSSWSVATHAHFLGLMDSDVCRACAFLGMICHCLLLVSDTPKPRLAVAMASQIGLPRMGVPTLGYPLASPFSCFDAGSAKPGDRGMMS